jgi:uncharacterized membrane protein YccC
MSTPTIPAANGRARKSLEGQLDRFDRILDGLADALNESVADAVRDAVGQAVREAVHAVVAELVANPDVAKALAAAHGLTAPPAPPPEPAVPRGPSLRERLAARWHRLRSGVAAATGRVVGAVFGWVRSTRALLTAAVRLARADRRGVTLTALVGVVVGIGCHLCGPAVAVTVSGIASATLALVGWLLRPFYPVLPLLASARTADRSDGQS